VGDVKNQRLAVIGAGPIGLEAALHGVARGWDVRVFERGRIAEHVRDWGHVRLFSPFGLNSSELGRQAIRAASDETALPSADELLTGRQFAERYLDPLSRLPELAGRIHENTAVVGLSRSRWLKGEQIGRPQRARDPFQLLLRDDRGERIAEADVVLDCSGVYGRHNFIGAGGTPCPGERNALADRDYRLPDILGTQRAEFAGKRTLVVGSGFSAATAVVALAELTAAEPGTTVVWITRTGRTPPMERIDGDLLRERDRLAAAANELALGERTGIDWRPSTVVRRIARRGSGGGYDVELQRGQRDPERIAVDRIVANVGYRPDRSLYEELQIHECYATQGPMKLAAALLGETSRDCLAQADHGVDALRNPEPGFFILGAKSYGRDSRFLIDIGLRQIQDVFDEITIPFSRDSESSERSDPLRKASESRLNG
jgi:thioredoxin reductase